MKTRLSVDGLWYEVERVGDRYVVTNRADVVVGHFWRGVLAPGDASTTGVSTEPTDPKDDALLLDIAFKFFLDEPSAP